MFSTEVIYEVLSFSVGDTKAGTKMGKLQLKNSENDSILNCILWEETLNRIEAKVLRAGNKVRIVTASFNEKFNNCLISSLELIEEGKIGLTKEEIESTYAEIMSYIDNISNEKLKDFVKGIFVDNEERIKVAPAAKLMHHNYIGGLMVHTLECVKIAEKVISECFQRINKDEAIAACLLHDIGKIFEYTIDTESGLIDYDENFRKEWITHSQYGFSICKVNGFTNVARMIAAHHGRTEWGAIIDLDEKDLEPYVYLIHHVDDISAKFGKIYTTML